MYAARSVSVSHAVAAASSSVTPTFALHVCQDQNQCRMVQVHRSPDSRSCRPKGRTQCRFAGAASLHLRSLLALWQDQAVWISENRHHSKPVSAGSSRRSGFEALSQGSCVELA